MDTQHTRDRRRKPGSGRKPAGQPIGEKLSIYLPSDALDLLFRLPPGKRSAYLAELLRKNPPAVEQD